MTSFRIGIVGAVALAALACAGSTRSGKPASSESGGTTIKTAAEEREAASATAGATPAGTATREVEGRVELIDRANNVTLAGTESVGRAFEKFKIDEDTKITVNGEQATVNEINPGDEVRASFSGEGDELRLERLEIVSPQE
jgi:hypothetical protein